MRSKPTGLMVAVLAALAATGASPTRAAGCDDRRTQTGMNACAEQGFERADAELNAVYGLLLKERSLTARLDQLKAAERAWIAYRDAQCAFAGSAFEGGSMQPMVIQGCAEGLTEHRTAALKSDLACAKDPSKC